MEGKRQVSLIIPKFQNSEMPKFFMGIWYVASYLEENGFLVKIYDNQHDEAINNLKEIIDNSFLVGFTVMTDQIKNAKDLSVEMHKHSIPVVWGGIHPTLFPEQCLREDYVDYVVYDQGEKAAVALAKMILDGSNDPADIQGIYYKADKGHVTKTAHPGYIKLNGFLPHLDLIDFNKYENSLFVNGKHKKTINVHVGRGCPFRCSFCINTIFVEHKWQGLSAEEIFGLLDLYETKYPLEHVAFGDDNFCLNKTRLKRFCEIYEERKCTFSWVTTTRAGYLRPAIIDDALLQQLKRCNCTELQMGIESGSQRVLDQIIYKDLKLDDVYTAVKRLGDAGIRANCSFMIGMPHETKEEQQMTLNLIKKLKKINPDTIIIGPQLYRPYPGAKLSNMAEELGFKMPQDIDSWIKFLNSSGFVDIVNYPWIKNKQELQNICDYYNHAEINPRGLNYIPGMFFKGLFNLRKKLDFYHFGFDLVLYKKLKAAYLSLASKKY